MVADTHHLKTHCFVSVFKDPTRKFSFFEKGIETMVFEMVGVSHHLKTHAPQSHPFGDEIPPHNMSLSRENPY